MEMCPSWWWLTLPGSRMFKVCSERREMFSLSGGICFSIVEGSESAKKGGYVLLMAGVNVTL